MDEDVRRCHATILFSDVCGSTELAETCDPEELALILSQVREVSEQVLAQYGGVINQFYGDGILAAFGFNNPSEESVKNAACAALALHETINKQTIKLFSGAHSIRMHSGIHSGLIVVQQGDELQGRYKLYGDVLNTAARIADAAGKDQILASAEAVRGVLPYFKTKAVEPLNLKGKSGSVEAYYLLGRSDVTTRYEAAKCRGLTPFTARESELRTLTSCCAKARANQLQIVSVVGDAGLGKTRLVERWLGSLNSADFFILRGYCLSNVRGVPLRPFVDILKRFLGINERASAQEIHEKIQFSKVIFGVESFDRVEELKELLVYSCNPESSQDGLSKVHVWADLIADIFIEQIKQKPMIVFIDDWHWADESSRLVLLRFLELAKNKSLMVVLATRTLGLDDPADSGVRIDLMPFQFEAAKQVVMDLALAKFDTELIKDIHERTGGNPLFIEELCRSLLNEQQLGNKHVALSHIPATLHGLIEARVQHLPKRYGELVRTASVLGRVFSQSLLQSVLAEPLTDEMLETLAERDLIYEGEEPGSLRFKHGITRDVIYHSVVLKKRRDIHSKIASILSSCSNNNGLAHLELLVYHYAGAGDNDRAVDYSEKAGDRAMRVSSLDCARYHYRLALDLLKKKEQTPLVMERLISLSIRWAFAAAYKPAPDDLSVLFDALECAQTLKNDSGCAQINHALGWIYYVLGKPLVSITHLENALLMAQRIGDTKLAAQIDMTLAQSHVSAGNYNKALVLLAEAIDVKLLHPSTTSPPIGLPYGIANQGLIFGDRGDFDTAHDRIQMALGALGGASHAIEGSVLAIEGVLHVWQGNWTLAKRTALKQKQVTESFSATQSYTIACAVENYAEWMLKEDAGALIKLQQAIDWMREHDFYMFSSVFIGWLSDAFLRNGDYDQATYYAEKTVERLKDGDRMGVALAYRTLASVSLEQPGQLAQKVEYYLDKSAELAIENQSKHNLAATNLLRGRWLKSMGRVQESASVLAQVSKEFREMDMSWHLAQANEVLRALNAIKTD